MGSNRIDTNSGLALGYLVVDADAHSIRKTRTDDKALVWMAD